MTRIALLSDTHGWLDPQIKNHLKDCHEIWHAGDVGNAGIISEIKQYNLPVKGVSGNIDGQDVKNFFPEQLVFHCERVKVMIRHIGGYPPKYNPETKKELLLQKPALFISGHSHILKVMFDDKIQCLHMNPGAAGRHGWHKVRTMIRFVIDGNNMKDLDVIELGQRSS